MRNIIVFLLELIAQFLFISVTLAYFLAKIVFRWFFHFEKPKETYLEWWRKNNILDEEIFKDRIYNDRDTFTPMKFVKISNYATITITDDDGNIKPIRDTPYLVTTFILLIPFVICVPQFFGHDMFQEKYLSNQILITSVNVIVITELLMFSFLILNSVLSGFKCFCQKIISRF